MQRLLECFSAAVAARDTEAMMRLFAGDAPVVVVTSGLEVLQGLENVRLFLDRYAEGSTAYRWQWQRCAESFAGPFGWLIAEGIEYVESEKGASQHPYRMTMITRYRRGAWELLHVHGSSPSLD
jgi:ketosteroid isomerase-like protein